MVAKQGQADLSAVRLSIRKHLLDELSDFDRNLFVAENRSHDGIPTTNPTTGRPTVWIKERFVVYLEHHPALQLHEAIGKHVFEVRFPAGRGTEEPEAFRKRIVDAFEKKYGLTNTPDLAVHIDQIVREQPFEIESWYSCPVSIHWRVYSEATLNRTT